MVTSRLGRGASDPVSYECICLAGQRGDGVVLLFYRYFANSPALPKDISTDVDRVEDLAAWHQQITARLNILGKIRVASEGFNVTVGGTKTAIQEYLMACTEHWSFKNLPLATDAERKAFFKPSPGCACVFHPLREASVRVCAEITPLGITNYAPSRWDLVEELPPAEFHRRCHEDSVSLLDLRNHYESRIGYFVNPQTSQAALKPQIRRFSQWPRYFNIHEEEILKDLDTQGQLLTYCTGGIRCEKATRWMAERDTIEPKRHISTLRGGIAAYLDWMAEEIAAGRMESQDSLFKGKNYVFDARGSAGSDSLFQRPVSQCHMCGVQEDRLGKCQSNGCHLVLVICIVCEALDPRCCEDCRESSSMPRSRPKDLCSCEKEREHILWGLEQGKQQRSQGWRKAKRATQKDLAPIQVIVEQPTTCST